jgi:hypothetical protein
MKYKEFEDEEVKMMDELRDKVREIMTEEALKIEELGDKLNGGFLKKFCFRMCCTQLSIYKDIMQTQNVKFDEINFETIFNHFEEVEKIKEAKL